MNILAHTCFIGTTGYNNHARSFFCALNKHHKVKVVNVTVGPTWKGYNMDPHKREEYMTEEMKEMLHQQVLTNPDGSFSNWPLQGYIPSFKPDVTIVLNEVNSRYFYQELEGYKIAYTVWESTRLPEDFFRRLFYFDEVWVPTQWQMDSMIEQGFPAEKLFVVPEGVDEETFKPGPLKEEGPFRFLLFGRWEHRKATTEIIRAFGETFQGDHSVELVCSVNNPYATDGYKTSQERAEAYGVNYDNVKFIDFADREDYINYLQQGHVFVSCARSEGWNLPLIEAMASGIPSIYSNWGGQLEFAKGKGIPVKISRLAQANIFNRDIDGQFCEPNFFDLAVKMMLSRENYTEYRDKALKDSEEIRKEFTWAKAGARAAVRLDMQLVQEPEEIIEVPKKKKKSPKVSTSIKPFAFVTTGNSAYMPVIEKLVHSIQEFSKADIIVYGVNCDVPFDGPQVVCRRIDPPKHSKHDKWYWKQYACIESIKEEGYENFVWIDGDVVINYNFDEIEKYFPMLEGYPIPDIHIQEEFLARYGEGKMQLFNEELAKYINVKKFHPYAHVCMYIYDKSCGWWFEEIIKMYKETPLSEYDRLFIWNDEGMDNALRWKYGYKKFLPVSNFDTSAYDGDEGDTNQALYQFYRFWNEKGPQNFNRIYGYQRIPKDKSDILYFHGNKDSKISDKMIEFIKMQRDSSFYESEWFYLSKYNLEHLGDIKDIEGGTVEIAEKYGWPRAIYHEIYNLQDYYNEKRKTIQEGDIVVDLGGNIGIFNRWAYSQGASKVISFEPDKRYFQLLQLNSDPKSILFNAAIGDKVGTTKLHETEHLGGSFTAEDTQGYTVRTYTLDYLFETGLVDRIDFLKVDIEGGEIAAFKGISDENLGKVRTIAMEYHHSHLGYDDKLREDFIVRLNRLGFNSYLLYLGNNNALQMIYFTR